jgi:hypothetical protein
MSIHTPLTTRRRPRTAAAVAVLAVGLGGLFGTSVTANAAPVDVSGVQFRWGFNNESNNRGAAPGTFNFFSAGKIGNPGSGGQVLTNASNGAAWANGAAAGWAANVGHVYIEKLQPDASYAEATWAGTKTDKDGVSIGPYATSTKFSDHQVVIDNGTGTLDEVGDDADIAWDGDFTVIYYSGYTFFYVSDPHLVVDNGTGTLTATLSGYGSDMDDMTQWNTLTPTEVTLATLSGVDVTADGLLTTPAYAAVTYEAPEGVTPQVRTGEHWGSFPTSFADFQQLTGQGAYWYSSGGAIDKNKHALPLTVDTTPEPRDESGPPVVKVTPTLAIAGSTSTYGKPATVTVTVSPPAGTPGPATGNITLTGAGATQTKPAPAGTATFALPMTLTPKTYTLTAAYDGNAQLNPAQATLTHTVGKATTARPTLKVTKKPTAKKAGKATVMVTSTVAPVTGRTTITLAKGKTKKKVTVSLKNGKAAAALPKLAKGDWKVAIAYAGSATHLRAVSKTYRLKVR